MESPAPAPAAPETPDTPAAPEAPGTPVVTGPLWRFLITPRWVAWHLFVVAAFWGMLWLGDWQLRRALAGNGLSWAYTFEWPLFSGFALVFWARTIRDEFRLRQAADGSTAAESALADEPDLPDGLGNQQVERPADDADDAELASYNAYLAKLNAEVRGHGKWRGLR